MKAFTALIIVFHLCGSSNPEYDSADRGCVIQSEEMQLSRDFYNLLRSFYRNRAHNDKESIDNDRKKTLKTYEDEKDVANEKKKRPSSFILSIMTYYNRFLYWLISKENTNYERSLEYFILTVRPAFLYDTPNIFLEAYAKFFDEFSHRFFKYHLRNSNMRFLSDDIKSLRLTKELPQIFSENQNLGWNDYQIAIDKRLEELMKSFALKHGIQDQSPEVAEAEKIAN